MSGDGKFEGGCAAMLESPGIRFVGVINRMGRLAAGRFRSGVRSHLDDKEDRSAYMQLALEIFLGEQFDGKLGEVEYTLMRRKKIVVVCVPVGEHVILVSAEPDVDVNATVEAARGAFKGIA